ncbi:hypothetical protein B0H14DRAFT_3149939 [Mycena olivaceomarginata]|nr:hypothetical protein B0H14DRAFT_3149939 [Mycena olivaceomarginata]
MEITVGKAYTQKTLEQKLGPVRGGMRSIERRRCMRAAAGSIERRRGVRAAAGCAYSRARSSDGRSAGHACKGGAQSSGSGGCAQRWGAIERRQGTIERWRGVCVQGGAIEWWAGLGPVKREIGYPARQANTLAAFGFSPSSRARLLKRMRVASDASSFYFKAPRSAHGAWPSPSRIEYERLLAGTADLVLQLQSQLRQPSSQREQHEHQGSSLAHHTPRSVLTDSLMDSVMSDYSVARLGRPGVGDKMFATTVDHGQPLRVISASPPESRSEMRDRSSYDYDSIIDEERRDSMEDSLFEKTGHRSSMSSDSVFGYDDHDVPNGHLLPPNQFRPLSVLSFHNDRSPMKEDDTMISMLGGGGHVRQRSIGAGFEASPCVRVEKRKHNTFQDDDKAPSKARIRTKPSIASTSSSKFGGERMIKAGQGLLVRQSLEESALVAEGEDIMAIRPAAVFTHPSPPTPALARPPLPHPARAPALRLYPPQKARRCRMALSPASTCLRSTLRSPTLPTRCRQVPLLLGCVLAAAATAIAAVIPLPPLAPRARGARHALDHRLQEEQQPTACQGIFIVDPDSDSVDLSTGGVDWDDERGIVALRNLLAAQELRGHASAAPALGPDLRPTAVLAGPA